MSIQNRLREEAWREEIDEKDWYTGSNLIDTIHSLTGAQAKQVLLNMIAEIDHAYKNMDYNEDIEHFLEYYEEAYTIVERNIIKIKMKKE